MIIISNRYKERREREPALIVVIFFKQEGDKTLHLENFFVF